MMMNDAPTILNPNLAPRPPPVETTPLQDAVKACQVTFSFRTPQQRFPILRSKLAQRAALRA